MGFKEALQKWNEKRQEEKTELKLMERQARLQRRFEHKQKSPAQKELEFYEREKANEYLKLRLNAERKEREEKMKNLSNPFNKNNNMIMGDNSMMRGGMRWMEKILF